MATAHTTTRSPVGEHLLALRTARGWSLREIERRSGGLLRSGHLSQIESGKVQEPSLSVLRELARTFDMNLSQFMSELDLDDDPDAPAMSDAAHRALQYFSGLMPAEQEDALKYLQFLSEYRRKSRRGPSDEPVG